MDTTPLTIITGFLGAGKTTLLNRILHAEHGLRVAVLVNDFGAINIDSQLIVGVEGDTVSLSNGCICCTIRDDLLKAVFDLLQRTEPPEYIIVEASGVSDPLEVALSFRYMRGVFIDSIISVIDAEQILTLDPEYTVLAMNQIGMADLVLLNKVDLVTPDELEQARAYIRGIIRDSRIIETTNADVPLALLLNVGHFSLERLAQRQPQEVHVHEEADEDHAHTDHSLVFQTWSWNNSQPVSYKALKRMVDHLPPSIYRAKGVFFLADAPDQRAVLQVVGRRANLDAQAGGWADETPRSQFVVIGKAGEIDTQDLAHRMERCLAVNAPPSEITRITNTALAWLRQRLQKD